MADVLTSQGELTWVSFPITKVEPTPDGDLLIWGKATDNSVDSDEQIVDEDFAAKALGDWFETGPNIRVQHQAQRDPAGVGVHYERDGSSHWVKSLIVEPIAKNLVSKGVLRAYSVGIAHPTIVRDRVARGGRITDGQIVEISLVDRPANKSCQFQLVKAATDGTCEYVGKMLTAEDMLTKEAGNGDVTVTLPSDMSLSFTPNDLARILNKGKSKPKEDDDDDDDDNDMQKAEDAALVKAGEVLDKGHRKFSAEARRRHAEAGNALPDGSYPIPDKDALRRAAILARSKHGNWQAARRLISRRARELGAANPLKEKATAEKILSEKAIRRQVAQLARELAPEVTKKHKVICAGCGAKQNIKHDKCSECGKALVGAPPIQKNHDFVCLKCGKELDKGEQYCPSCGKKNPGYLPEADKKIPANKGEGEPVLTKAGFGSTANPGAGVVGHGADIMSVPPHREPDGPAVEAMETDSGLPHDGSASEKNAGRLAKIGAPREMAAIHDFTCPAFKWDDALKCYPEGFGIIDVPGWQSKMLDYAASAPYEEAGRALLLSQQVVTLKGAAMEDVLEVKKDLNKAFRDANPGPGSFPTPHEMRPAGSFRRPYLTSGHSSPSHQQAGPNSAPMQAGHIGAGDFTRGYLDAGHATESPANTGAHQPVPTPKLEGVPTSVEYKNPLRDAASNAMNAMHAHVAATFPDLCPMTDTDIGPSNGPAPGVNYQVNTPPRPMGAGIPEAQKGATDGHAAHGTMTMSRKARKKLARKIKNRMFGGNQAPPFGSDSKKKNKALTSAALQKTIAATLKERDKKLNQRLAVKGAAKAERTMLARELGDQLAAQIGPIRETLAAQQNVAAQPVTVGEAAQTREALQRTVSKALRRQDKRDAQLNQTLQGIAARAAEPAAPGQPNVTPAQVTRAINKALGMRDKQERAMRRQLSDRLSELTAKAAAAGTPTTIQKGITRSQMQKAIGEALDRRDLALADRLQAQLASVSTLQPAVVKGGGVTKGQVTKAIQSALQQRDHALEQRDQALADRLSAQIAQLQQLPVAQKSLTKAIQSALLQRDQALAQRDDALAERLSAQIAQMQQLPVAQKSLTKAQVARTIDAALAQRDATLAERMNAMVASVGRKPQMSKGLRRGDIQKTIKSELRRRDEQISDKRLIEQLLKQHQAGPGPSPTAGASTIKQQFKKERKRLVKKLRKRMMKALGKVPEPPVTMPPPSVPAQKGASKAQVEKAISAALARQEAALTQYRGEERSARERDHLSKQLSYEISREIRSLVPQQRSEPAQSSYQQPLRTYAPLASVPYGSAKKVTSKGSSNAEIAKMIKREIARQSKLTQKLINKKIQPVEKAVFALADQPDPATQAFKGQAMNGFRPVGASTRSPVGAQAADSAERTQQMMLQELEDQFRNSPDPAQREAAWRVITKMRGLSDN